MLRAMRALSHLPSTFPAVAEQGDSVSGLSFHILNKWFFHSLLSFFFFLIKRCLLLENLG